MPRTEERGCDCGCSQSVVASHSQKQQQQKRWCVSVCCCCCPAWASPSPSPFSPRRESSPVNNRVVQLTVTVTYALSYVHMDIALGKLNAGHYKLARPPTTPTAALTSFYKLFRNLLKV
ncbi:hypothetical protein J6590_052048 [Homalodisca vitripennis]|nr:hypothetical protein J6590_052048 [Homalodisca vitripennis]